MKIQLINKLVFFSALSVLLYFLWLYSFTYFDIKDTPVIVGVFVELLTIPAFLATPVILVASFFLWYKSKWNPVSFPLAAILVTLFLIYFLVKISF
ncbi:hypothetical protein LX95_00432 [Mesonia algae]|uniref:Uncharacterized protein n=1 Tax=Mesonia algae TaxID=213248 RepID=A0A2W7IEP5_9FLAO|nr:hypothetical protein [Mesonia algae]PZW44102.1 hypothetical protein LX95_00432 [Mesonia algae]